MVEECRQAALDATEGYQDQVFDWRANGAGRWADEFPNRGVVLGSADPKLFKKLLGEHKDAPLRAAQNSLAHVLYARHAHRTMAQIAADGAVPLGAFELDLFAPDSTCWSGISVEIPPVGSELLRKLWNGAHGFWSWSLKNAVALAAGEYLIDSGFYSVPDYSPKVSPETLKDVLETPGRYALVFLDYHF